MINLCRFYINRTLGMTFNAPTNVGKHLQANVACAHGHLTYQYTNNSVFLAQITLCVMMVSKYSHFCLTKCNSECSNRPDVNTSIYLTLPKTSGSSAIIVWRPHSRRFLLSSSPFLSLYSFNSLSTPSTLCNIAVVD